MHSLYVSSFFFTFFRSFPLYVCFFFFLCMPLFFCLISQCVSLPVSLFLYLFIFFFLSISLSISVCLLFTFSISVTLYLPLLLSCFSCADSTPTHEPLPIWLAFFLSQSPLLPPPPLLELLWFWTLPLWSLGGKGKTANGRTQAKIPTDCQFPFCELLLWRGGWTQELCVLHWASFKYLTQTYNFLKWRLFTTA